MDPIFSYLNVGYTVLYVYKIHFNIILPSAVYPQNHFKKSKLLSEQKSYTYNIHLWFYRQSSIIR